MTMNEKELLKMRNQQYRQNKRMEVAAEGARNAAEMKNEEVANSAVESFADEIIIGAGGYTGEKSKKEVAKNYINDMYAQGAAMAQAIADAGSTVPATAGVFAGAWEEWTADGENAAVGSLWRYKGVGYQARTAIQKIEAYAPDLAVNNYAVRPIPDALGIYPATMNMDVSVGMKLRGADGLVYECYANPITSLQWQPADVPSSFRLYEE